MENLKAGELYTKKIIEVAYFDLIPDTELVSKIVNALITEFSDQQTKELREEHNELITKYNSSNNMLCEYMMAIEEIIGFAGPLERVKEELNKLGKLREEIERLKESKWISVEDIDKLPNIDESVLCKFKEGRQDVCKYTKVFKLEFVENCICQTEHITHWQPLPNNPI